MMRRWAVVLIVVFVTSMVSPALAQQPTGGVSGTAKDDKQNVLGGATIQLRSVATGQVVGSATASATGTFSFASIVPGQYVIEIVNAAGQVLGTASVTVVAGAVATVAVTATAAGLAAAAAAGAGGLAGLFSGTSLLVISAVTAAAVTVGVVAARGPASPSR